MKSPGIMSCILTRCTNDKNLVMIQPFEGEIAHFVFWDLDPWWLSKNQIGPKFILRGHLTWVKPGQ
jgi:hypothetical protein